VPLVRSTALVLFPALAAGYLGVSAYAALRMTRPERSLKGPTPAVLGRSFEEVIFPARRDAVPIAAWYLPREGADRALVLAHGRHGSRFVGFSGRWLELAEHLWKTGFSILILDLRAHGESGAARITFGLQERDDVCGAVDWLLARGHRPGSLGVLGVSLGGAAAIGAAAECSESGALVVDASFADIQPGILALWRQESGLPSFFWPGTRWMIRLLLGYDPCDARPEDEMAAIAPRPAMIVHGALDEVVPLEHARRLAARNPFAELWVVPNAAHADSYLMQPALYRERVARFFERSLPSGAASAVSAGP
jgi:uncharacterized protein